ncbi:MAG: Ada metal-binding domain-containing protein [Paracoccaceae bacterium]
MENSDNLWNSVLRADPRPNPAFLYAVKTTGIYCRPSCPSKRPLRKNVEFFETSQAAQLAGYRACLRCTPE